MTKTISARISRNHAMHLTVASTVTLYSRTPRGRPYTIDLIRTAMRPLIDTKTYDELRTAFYPQIYCTLIEEGRKYCVGAATKRQKLEYLQRLHRVLRAIEGAVDFERERSYVMRYAHVLPSLDAIRIIRTREEAYNAWNALHLISPIMQSIPASPARDRANWALRAYSTFIEFRLYLA